MEFLKKSPQKFLKESLEIIILSQIPERNSEETSDETFVAIPGEALKEF